MGDFVLTISLDLTKSSEVRKAGDWSNNVFQKRTVLKWFSSVLDSAYNKYSALLVVCLVKALIYPNF